MEFIVEKEWLLKQLHEPNVRTVDCRFSLADPQKGAQEYDLGHIPGAVFFDLEKDLSGRVGTHGGRHPLPEMKDFVQKLEQAGIDDSTTIITYDHGEGAFAARFWWMLKLLGHEKVYVLNGGFTDWELANYPVTTNIPQYEKKQFKVNLNPDILASVEEVREVVSGQNPDTVLIDSREERRYLGLEEPIDKKAGRIPGAVNKPWFEGLRDRKYKPAEEQRERFTDIDSEKLTIVYCGSGVTAAPNFLALKTAGYEKVKLYLGSFSDWISYSENEIE
nr:sulfurtransferase [Neobacillus sp. Marseille-Q6967]